MSIEWVTLSGCAPPTGAEALEPAPAALAMKRHSESSGPGPTAGGADGTCNVPSPGLIHPSTRLHPPAHPLHSMPMPVPSASTFPKAPGSKHGCSHVLCLLLVFASTLSGLSVCTLSTSASLYLHLHQEAAPFFYCLLLSSCSRHPGFLLLACVNRLHWFFASRNCT